MTILRESPWYYEIHKEGYEQGIEQGIEEGLEQGIEQGSRQTALHNLTNLLRYRFGLLPASLSASLKSLPAAHLQTLFNIALEIPTLDEFEVALSALSMTTSNGHAA